MGEARGTDTDRIDREKKRIANTEEERTKAKKKAEIDEKKNALRAEDIQKGVFIRIGDMPKKEPTFRKAANQMQWIGLMNNAIT